MCVSNAKRRRLNRCSTVQNSTSYYHSERKVYSKVGAVPLNVVVLIIARCVPIVSQKTGALHQSFDDNDNDIFPQFSDPRIS
jgi:hypothetical protein